MGAHVHKGGPEPLMEGIHLASSRRVLEDTMDEEIVKDTEATRLIVLRSGREESKTTRESSLLDYGTV
jgi:hypothetical protein